MVVQSRASRRPCGHRRLYRFVPVMNEKLSALPEKPAVACSSRGASAEIVGALSSGLTWLELGGIFVSVREAFGHISAL